MPCIQVIQIDEAALREGLPLRKSEQADYLNWAVHSFRITNCGLKDTTQVKGSFIDYYFLSAFLVIKMWVLIYSILTILYMI